MNIGLKTVSTAELGLAKALGASLGQCAPLRLSVLGDLAFLRRDKLGLFCSVKCPGDLILRAYDYAKRLRDDGVAVIGGFHSPVEQECLRILLRGTQPVIICPARSLGEMRLPGDEARVAFLQAPPRLCRGVLRRVMCCHLSPRDRLLPRG